MKGGTHDVYDWLNIPGLIRKDTGSLEWYNKQIEEFGYTHVKPITYDLKRPEEAYDEEGDSSFWSIRKTVETLKGLRLKDPYTFYSQYMGKPIGKGKAALSSDNISYYHDFEELRSKITHTFITADTASTTKTYSDYSVAVFWGVIHDRILVKTSKGTKMENRDKLVLIDIIRDKWETPELITVMRSFWKLHNVYDMSYPRMKPNAFYMEDKSSGLFLNQQFLKDGTVLVKPVPRDGNANNDKFSRFINTVPYFESGQILVPKHHEETKNIKLELVGQSELGSSTGHDDIADNFSDAVAIVYTGSSLGYGDWA